MNEHFLEPKKNLGVPLKCSLIIIRSNNRIRRDSRSIDISLSVNNRYQPAPPSTIALCIETNCTDRFPSFLGHKRV